MVALSAPLRTVPSFTSGGGFDPLKALGSLSSIPGISSSSGPAISGIDGDVFARTGAFNVGDGTASDGTSPPGTFGNVGPSLFLIAALGAAAWIIVAALRR